MDIDDVAAPPERRRYDGLTEAEATKKFEAEIAAMELMGLQPGRQEWSKQERRLRPDLHVLTVDWVAEDAWSGARFYPTGEIRVRANTKADMQVAIAQLQVRKKEIALEKKDLTVVAREMRAQVRAAKAQRGGLHRGSGTVNRAWRDAQRAQREGDDQRAARQVAGVEAQKVMLDRQAVEIDRLIVELQRRARQSA